MNLQKKKKKKKQKLLNVSNRSNIEKFTKKKRSNIETFIFEYCSSS